MEFLRKIASSSTSGGSLEVAGGGILTEVDLLNEKDGPVALLCMILVCGCELCVSFIQLPEASGFVETP